MPITDPTLAAKLKAAGLNPDDYDVAENQQQFNSIFGGAASPIEPEQQNPTKDAPSVLTTVRQSAIRNAVPAATGLATAGAMGGLLSGLGLTATGAGAPVGIPMMLGSAAAMIGSGIAGGMLAKKAQDSLFDKVFPEYKKQEELDRQTNPKAAVAGEILANAPFMAPNVGNVVSAGKGAANLVGRIAGIGTKPSAPEINNLLNVGLGAALPAGIRATTDPDATASTILMEGLGGAFLNSPTKLGVRLGLHPDINVPTVNKEAIQLAQRNLPPELRPSTVEPGNVEHGFNEDLTVNPFEEQLNKLGILKQQIAKEKSLGKSIDAAIKSENEPAVLQEQANKLAAQNSKKINELQAQQKIKEFEQQSQINSEYEDLVAKVGERDAEIIYQNQLKLKEQQRQLAENERMLAELKQKEFSNVKAKVEGIKKEDFFKPTENQPRPLVRTEADKEIYPDYTGNQEFDATLNAKELTEAERIQDEFDRGIREQKDSELKDQLESQGYTGALTKDSLEELKKLGALRNVKILEDGSIVDSKGNPISAQATLRQGLQEGLAKVNPVRAGLDSIPHELTHQLYADMKTLGDKQSKALIERANKVIGESPAFKEWQKTSQYTDQPLDIQIEEFLAHNSGERSVTKLLKLDKKGDFRNWFDSFWSHARLKYGKATDEDVARIFSHKVLEDDSFANTFGGAKVNNVKDIPEETRNQADSDLPLKDAEVEYAGYQEGFGTKPGFHMFKLKKTLNENLVEGSHVTEKYLKHNGFKVPDGVIPESAKVNPDGSVRQQKLSDLLDINKSTVERIRSIPSPKSAEVADAAEKFFQTKRALSGKFQNEFLGGVDKIIGFPKNLKDYWTHDSAELRKVQDWFDKTQDGLAAPTLNAKEVELRDKVIRPLMAEVIKEKSTRPGLRQTDSINPNYLPQTPSRKVIQTLSDNIDSPESLKLKKDFIDWQIKKAGKSQTEAEKTFKDFIDAWSTNKTTDIASQFGPIDKAEGIGIPDSWREKHLITRVNRYLDRVQRRFAYYDAFEVNNKQGELALKHLAANKDVANLKDEIGGINFSDNPILDKVAGVVKSGMMGTLTGIKDLTSSQFLGFQHHQNPVQSVKAALAGWAKLKENFVDSFKTGFNKRHVASIEMGFEDLEGVLGRTRDLLTDLSGRNILEQISRATTLGQGKYLVQDFLIQQRAGKLDEQGKLFFDSFAKDLNWKSGNLTPEQILEVATRYGESVQGTYDARGLPPWATKGFTGSLAQLARWNIEKVNNYNKFVVKPAKAGNYKPLLYSTLGMVLGGAAITEIVEAITKRKDKAPTIKELEVASQEGEDISTALTYKFAGLAAAAGHIGLVGDLVKSVMDVTYAKQRPQVYNNPALEAIDNVTATTTALVKAIIEDGVSADLLYEGIHDILYKNLQVYRLALAQVGEDTQKDIEKKNKYRDLRTFKLLRDQPVSDLNAEFPKIYQNQNEKKFKETEDLQEAAKLLPDLIKKAIEDSEGDIDVLKQKLTSLKKNQYPTMPNINSMPLSFGRYYKNLIKTQGQEKADEVLKDYLVRNLLNRTKSKLVP